MELIKRKLFNQEYLTNNENMTFIRKRRNNFCPKKIPVFAFKQKILPKTKIRNDFWAKIVSRFSKERHIFINTPGLTVLIRANFGAILICNFKNRI